MKIAFIPHIEHYTVGLLRELSKFTDIVVISERTYDVNNVKYIYLPKSSLMLVNIFLRTSFLKKISSYLSCDIFHVNSAIDGASVIKVDNILLTEHGWPNIWVESFTRKPYYIKETKCLKELNSVGVPIITISEFSRKMLSEYLDIKVSKVIYHGLLDKFRTTSPRFPKKTHVILWVGRLVPAKEPEVFVKALGLIKSKVRFKAVIRGDGPLKRKILKLIKKMKLKNRVYFVKKLPFSSLPELYSFATLYVHTASMEPFGLSLLEAMGSGLPVIVAKGGGAYEVAGSRAVTFYPGDAADLAEKIESLLEDEEEYYKQSKRSIERAKFFSWRKAAREYLDLYKRL